MFRTAILNEAVSNQSKFNKESRHSSVIYTYVYTKPILTKCINYIYKMCAKYVANTKILSLLSRLQMSGQTKCEIYTMLNRFEFQDNPASN